MRSYYLQTPELEIDGTLWRAVVIHCPERRRRLDFEWLDPLTDRWKSMEVWPTFSRQDSVSFGCPGRLREIEEAYRKEIRAYLHVGQGRSRL